MAASTSFGERDEPVNGDEIIQLASTDSEQPPTDLKDRITITFKETIYSSSTSQGLMILTSGMLSFKTTSEDNLVALWLYILFNVLVLTNVIILIILIIKVQKKAFKIEDGQCSARTMAEASKLQKCYRCFGISLFVLQVLFTIGTGVNVSGVMEEDHKNDTSTVTIATSTIGEYVGNTTSG